MKYLIPQITKYIYKSILTSRGNVSIRPSKILSPTLFTTVILRNISSYVMEGSNTVYIITRDNPLFKIVKEGHSERELMYVISYILYRNGYISVGNRVVSGADNIIKRVNTLGHPVLMRELLPEFVSKTMSEYVVRGMINDDERLVTVMYELSGRIKISFIYTQQLVSSMHQNIAGLPLTITKIKPPTLKSLVQSPARPG